MDTHSLSNVSIVVVMIESHYLILSSRLKVFNNQNIGINFTVNFIKSKDLHL